MFDFETLTQAQKEAVTRSDAPAFIMAQAGTGKTFTLSKRIAYQMSEPELPLSPENLLGITFTEAAAAELLDRARKQAIAAGAAKADEMEAAWVSTIHSMCRRMLSENALDIEADPGIVVLAEAEAENFLTDAIEDAIAAGPYADAHAAMEAAGGYNNLVTALRQVQQIAFRTPGGVEALDFGPLGDAGIGRAVNDFAVALGQAQASYELALSSASKKSAEGLENDLGMITRAISLASGNTAELAEFCSGELKLASRVKAVGDDKKAVMSAAGLVTAATTLESDMQALLWVKRASRAVEENLSSALDDISGFTFDSLLSRCHELFGMPGVKESYASQFSSVMVDEFQDTDAIQSDIVLSMCEGEHGLDKLITVGDRQQSIYGFRGAEVSISDDMQDEMEGYYEKASIPLDVNFRSNPDILDFVRCVFSSPELFGGKLSALSPGPKNAGFALSGEGGRATVEMKAFVGQSGSDEAKSSGRAEARLIAQEFARIRETSPECSFDDMALLLRGFSNVETFIKAFRDVNVPCAITGGRKFYSFPEVQTLVDLMRLLADPSDNEVMLRCMCGPLFALEDADLACVKSLYNEEVTRIIEQTQQKRRDVIIPVFGILQRERALLTENSKEMLSMLENAWEALEYEKLSRVVKGLLDKLSWRENLAVDPLSASGKLANTDKVLDIVGELESEAGLNWRGVVEEVVFAASSATESFSAKDNSQAPGRTIGSHSPGCVSIMTIHAAKGLEFDVVAVADMEMGSSRSSFAMSKTGKADGARKTWIGVDLRRNAKDIGSLGEDAVSNYGYLGYLCELAAMKEDNEQEEAKRLAYVALTRPRKKLLWTTRLTYTKKGEPGKGDELFKEAACRVTGLETSEWLVSGEFPRIYACEQGDFATLELLESDMGLEGVSASIALPHVRKEAKSTALPARVEIPKHFSTASFSSTRESASHNAETTLSDHPLFEGTSKHVIGGVEQMFPTSGRTSSGESDSQAFGTLFHELMSARFLAGPLFDEKRVIAKRAEASELSEKRVETACRLSQMVFEHLSANLEEHALVSEAPMFFEIEERSCVTGYLDLLATKGGSAKIIDYKTGYDDASASFIARRYGYQAAFYALGTLRRGDVDKVQVVFLTVGRELSEVTLPVWTAKDVPALEELVRKAVASGEAEPVDDAE